MEAPTALEVRELHRSLIDLVALLNQPQRDSVLLREAGVRLDRALFPLLIAIEARGPIGVVDLGELVGRDYTTISRQVPKLERRGLIRRRPSASDGRIQESLITPRGRRITKAIAAARERMAADLFRSWSRRDLRDLTRLMRRFANDFAALPLPSRR